jgi:hypothetical protein
VNGHGQEKIGQLVAHHRWRRKFLVSKLPSKTPMQLVHDGKNWALTMAFTSLAQVPVAKD